MISRLKGKKDGIYKRKEEEWQDTNTSVKE